MSKVAIVTDSTAGIPNDLSALYPIKIAPQVLIWDNETLLDGIDIQPSEFYTRQTARVMPSTSQVTPRSFQDIFSQLLEDGYEVLAILISCRLSGTIDSAEQARLALPGAPIEIVDSTSTSMALGFPVLTAARAAIQGASLAECKAIAIQTSQHTGVFFAVETLEFLQRGGRIGSAARWVGTALNLKPILEVIDGKVEAVERIRTRKKSIARMFELVEQRIGGRTPVRLGVLHANVPDEAQSLLEYAIERLQPIEKVLSDVSPVVGAHAGPGTVGIAFQTGY